MKLGHVAVFGLFIASPALANPYIVDTGPGTTGGGLAIFGVSGPYVQWLSGYVSLPTAETITSVEGFMSGRGILNISVYADATLPSGVPIYTSRPSNITNLATGWKGATGLSWALSAGNYWFSFEPLPIANGGFDGSVPVGAAQPLARYAFSSEYPTLGTWHSDRGGWGMRIAANSTVPEPASWALLFSGFALTGYALRRRRALALGRRLISAQPEAH